MVGSANLCILCKGGRALCGNKSCPLLSRVNVAPKIVNNLKNDFFGPSQSVFVGHVNYPNINVGPLGGLDNSPNLNNPGKWFGEDYNKIIENRSLLLRSKKVPASLIPSQLPDWVMFDIPDIELTPGDTYVIRLTAHPGSEYTWSAGNGDPYPRGDSSAHPDDFCFRTWASNGKPRNSIDIVRERPFPLINWFLDQNLNLFPILRQILDV